MATVVKQRELTTIARVPVEDELAFGNGGWVRYQHKRLPFPVLLRFAPNERGRLEIAELYVAGGVPITGELLRRINLGRIEASVNEEPRERLRLQTPGPDLATLASYYSTSFSFSGLAGEIPREKLDWVALSFKAQYDGSGERSPKRKQLSSPLGSIEYVVDAALDVPPKGSRAYPAEFYQRLAEVYKQLARTVRAPAEVIADANNVEVKRVHTWIEGARRKGFLPRGQQGKVG
jgi:hypothetical protein